MRTRNGYTPMKTLTATHEGTSGELENQNLRHGGSKAASGLLKDMGCTWVMGIVSFGAMTVGCLHGDPGPTLEQRAAAIVLPRVQFTGATLDEALNFLRAKARQVDPEQAGMNIVAYAKAPQARFTFDLHNVPLNQVLQQVTDHAGLELRYARGAAILDGRTSSQVAGADQGQTAASPLAAKAAAVVLPVVRFTDATLHQAVEFLRMKSRDLMPDHTALNVTIKEGTGAVAPTITLAVEQVSLLDALMHVATIAGFTVTQDGDVFVLVPLEP